MPVGQLTPCTTIPEPGLESVCCNYRSGPAPYSAREATAMTSPHAIRKSSPHSPQLEEAGCSKEDPTEPKIIFFFFFNTASLRDSQSNAIWHLLPQPPHSLSLCHLQPPWTPEISSESPSSHLKAFARAVFLCQVYPPVPPSPG